MAPQHVEVLETLINLKRKLRRDKEAASTQPIASATNRYNKLQKGASYVRAGALPYPHGPEGYKQTIEHAGYTRSILARNPSRFNDNGEELEDEDSDPEADADAQEENPYSGVRLEELLAPLRHPSELATHPTLSVPFLDSALPDLVESLDETLRHERANLWRAKTLQMRLLGDEAWMPLERLETKDDWDLFEPKSQRPEASKKRKRTEHEPAQNGIAGHIEMTETNGTTQTSLAEPIDATKVDSNEAQDDGSESTKQPPAATDVDMRNADATLDTATKTEEADEQQEHGENTTANGDTDNPNGTSDPENEGSNAGTPAPPSRRITRALAAENTVDVGSQRSRSPSISTVSSTLLTPDPIYLLPPSLSTASRLPQILGSLGLPIEELLETRKLLTMYIQKQEETIRGYDSIQQKLRKAKRMRSQVWDWSKAEGHVGEMSDGEDWIDAAAWGERAEDLKKGRDEDEVPDGQAEEEPTRGRAKGKRRRAKEKE